MGNNDASPSLLPDQASASQNDIVWTPHCSPCIVRPCLQRPLPRGILPPSRGQTIIFLNLPIATCAISKYYILNNVSTPAGKCVATCLWGVLPKGTLAASRGRTIIFLNFPMASCTKSANLDQTYGQSPTFLVGWASARADWEMRRNLPVVRAAPRRFGSESRQNNYFSKLFDGIRFW